MVCEHLRKRKHLGHPHRGVDREGQRGRMDIRSTLGLLEAEMEKGGEGTDRL